MARRRASDVSDGWRQGALFCGGKSEVQDQDKATTLESVNEIHAFGLHDKRRTRHKERRESSRSFPMRKGMGPFAGCESLRVSHVNLRSRL